MSSIPLHLQSPWSWQGVGQLKDLHHSMQAQAFLGRIYAFLTGQASCLLDLTTEIADGKIHNQYYAGIRTVPVNQIKGSEGRTGDFDCYFNPTQSRTIDRWVSVATARMCGDTLPLIELIQLGEAYFVRDGHHRISVARALGEEYVDAKITVLELTGARKKLVTGHLLHLEYAAS